MITVEKTCAQCSKVFAAKGKEREKKFCSMECYGAHRAENGCREREVTPIEFTCKVCGNPFFFKAGQLRSYHQRFAGKDPMYCTTKCGGIGRKRTAEAKQIHCVQCGKVIEFQRKPCGTLNRKKRYCGAACKGQSRRLGYQSRHQGAQPTRSIGRWGYIKLNIPGTNGNGPRSVLEHRYVMEQRLGRELLREETVHHKNGDRTFNDETNLELWSSHHGPGQRVTDKIAFAIEMIRLYPGIAREQGVMLADV